MYFYNTKHLKNVLPENFMALDLYLLRHGEVGHNVVENMSESDLILGRSNSVPLSSRGEKQADALGYRFSLDGTSFDEIHSSTALRARDTCERVCAKIGFPFNKVIFSDSLLEQSQGTWENKKRKDVYTREVLDKITEMHVDFCAPSGESQRMTAERGYSYIVGNFLDKKPEKDLKVAIFTHGMVKRGILWKILDSDPKLIYRYAIENCSITQVKYSFNGPHHGWHLVRVNDASHLELVGFKENSF